MAVLKCKMCGGTLEFTEGATVCECEYCGSTQTLPKVDDEKVLNLHERANRLRIACEFDRAYGVYESIISEKNDDAEAYWGLLLCRYGIEYVDDPATAKKIPTCHRSSFESFMEDSDFDMVMENADSLSRSVYRDQAKQIEEIRRGIIEVSGKEAPYDIFICYKETAEDGGRTIDSVLAQDVYDALTDKGYRVFFSRISLEDKLGTEYEPYIFAALNSAKIMLAFGTTYDYYNAVWVKNEWSRYLKLMAKDKEKHLIPCYKDIDAYDIPKEFKHLQGQDMGKVGAIQDLIRGIDKITGKTEKSVQSTSVPQQVGGINVDNLLKRGFMAIEDKDWSKADSFFEEVLNQNAEDKQAYFGKLLVEFRVVSKEELGEMHKSFEASKNYQKVLKFGDSDLKNELEKALVSIHENIAIDEKEEIYQRAVNYKMQKKYESAIEVFSGIIGFKDVEKQLEECEKLVKQKMEKAAEIEKKVGTIAETLEYQGEQHIREDLRTQVEDKKSLLNSLNREAADLQNLAVNLPLMEAEYNKLKKELADVDDQMNALNRELLGLGRFANKRKKEINNSLENLNLTRRQKITAIKEHEIKRKGFSSTDSISEKISENTDKIQEANNKLAELTEQLDAELAKASGIISFDEAMKLLEDSSICKAFMKKNAKLFAKIFGLKSNDNNVIFGKYENEDIEWRVLVAENGKALLLSEYGLDLTKYHKYEESITWDQCELRKWLNVKFLKATFSAEEEARIIWTDVSADKNPKHKTKPGKETSDKLFLLSILEAEKYFDNDESRRSELASNVEEPLSSEERYENGKTTYSWWLRSPGGDSERAAFVEGNGSINHSGSVVDYNEICVRPAMWINLDI